MFFSAAVGSQIRLLHLMHLRNEVRYAFKDYLWKLNSSRPQRVMNLLTARAIMNECAEKAAGTRAIATPEQLDLVFPFLQCVETHLGLRGTMTSISTMLQSNRYHSASSTGEWGKALHRMPTDGLHRRSDVASSFIPWCVQSPIDKDHCSDQALEEDKGIRFPLQELRWSQLHTDASLNG